MDANITTIVLALAALTIALSYTPLEFIFQLIVKRKPNPEELRMIKALWAIIAAGAIVILVVWIPKTIIDGITAFSVAYAPLFHLPTWGLQLILIAIVIVLILLFIRWFKKTAKKVAIVELSEKEKTADNLGGEMGKQIGKPKINIDFKIDTADIAKMNDGQRKSTGMFIDKLR